MIRDERLKTVRQTAKDAHLRPLSSAPRPAQPKPGPRQAKGANGPLCRHRGRVHDPIQAEPIERVFEGKTGVLFATGPSLTPEVVAEVMAARDMQELYLFGCNDSYRALPFLNVHYACDYRWWAIHYENMADYETTHGMWTQESNMPQSKFPNLHRIAGSNGKGFSSKQDLIYFGSNSGYQLMNLAYLFGIKNFILCGYNMSVVQGKKHFFGDHPQGLNRSGGYQSFVDQFKTIRPADYGIEIINATPESALTMFPKMALSEALKKWA